MVPGLGPATAAKIVAAFGDQSLAVLSSPDAEAKLAGVRGLGKLTAAKLARAWDATSSERNGVAFLTRLGLKPLLAQRCVRLLGPTAEAQVRACPFTALSRVRAVDFAAADAVAAALGGRLDAPGRVRAALREVLVGKAARSGHVYLPWRDACGGALRLLQLPRQVVVLAAEAEDFDSGAQPDWDDFTAKEGLPTAAHLLVAARELEKLGELAIEPPPAPPPPPPPPEGVEAEDWGGAGAMEQHRPEEEAEGELRDGSRLYLPELLEAERTVSSYLARAAALSRRPPPVPPNMGAWLDANESALQVSLSPEQRGAVAAAASQRVLILTGGPGTGKTFVMALAVRLWLAQRKRVQLCAPTGRAAQRMAELLAEVSRVAPELTSLPPPSTIHRLLEFTGHAEESAGGKGESGGKGEAPPEEPASRFSERFKRNAENPLELDALVVDEASMLDLPLAAALLAAMPTGASLLIIGDPDQLPPVGPGAPLRDSIRSGLLPESRLTALFRQYEGSLIARASQAVHAGSFPPLAPVQFEEAEEGAGASALGALAAKLKPRLPWDPREASFSARAAAAVTPQLALRAGMDALWLRLPDSASSYGEEGASPLAEPMRLLTRLVQETLPDQKFDPRKDLQVLVPMRKGPLGSAALCTSLAPLMNPRGEPGPGALPQLRSGSSVFALGDRVLQVVNDYEKEVFNGDLGEVVRVEVEARVLTVAYPNGSTVKYTGNELEALTPAWAITVHKAQGCEFPVVALLLDRAHGPLLFRNLLYTALSRAAKLLIVISPAQALGDAVRKVRSDDERYSGLQARLAADFDEESRLLDAGGKRALRPPPPPMPSTPPPPASTPPPPPVIRRRPALRSV